MLTYENTKVRISTENLVKTHISTKKCNLKRGEGNYLEILIEIDLVFIEKLTFSGERLKYLGEKFSKVLDDVNQCKDQLTLRECVRTKKIYLYYIFQIFSLEITILFI